MLTHQTQYRVCYADVDRMGYVYHGHYLRLFEIGRNEMIRSIYRSYAAMEDAGYMLPCRRAEIEYLRPAVLDELLTIRSGLTDVPGVRLTVHGEILNEEQLTVARSQVMLVFADPRTGRPRRPPADLVERIRDGLQQQAGHADTA